MGEYGYNVFLASLDEGSRHMAETLNNHISLNYPAYKPFDVKPKNRDCVEWVLNYRKKPKTGKPICNLYSKGGRLSVHFVFLTSMTHEVLLRQNEFGEKTRRLMLAQSVCRYCKGEGGCPWRQYFFINGETLMTCPYPYVLFENAGDGDTKDLLRLIDLQTRHMTQDAKDIKGSGYDEIMKSCCDGVRVTHLRQIDLAGDGYAAPEFCNPKRMDRYAAKYNLVLLGAGGGLWFYHSDDAVCGIGESDDSGQTCVPQGAYAAAEITNPFAVSAVRVWNHTVKWILENQNAVRKLEFNHLTIPYLARFYKENGNERMTVYVPVE